MIMYAWFFGYDEHKIFTEAGSEVVDTCPGVCHPGIVPDCDTLCVSLGFTGGYCAGLTCCCNPKSSKSLNFPPL